MLITTDTLEEYLPYYLTKDRKEGIEKAIAGFPKNMNYFTSLYPSDLLQGDGWKGLTLINFNIGQLQYKKVAGIVLSNSCDIDSNNSRDFPTNILFAPIIKLSNYIKKLEQKGIDEKSIASKVNSIKEQKITDIFYLPKGGRLQEEYIAVLNDVHTLPLQAFGQDIEKEKLYTLSQEGFWVFLIKLSIHFCRFHENVPR